MIAFNPFPPFLIFSTILLSISVADIQPGQSLSAANPNQRWTSPNNTFSLSFIPDSPETYFAAITYNGIPLWKAGGDSAVADSTASLTFLPDGNLRLVNGSSGAVVWQSNTAGRGLTWKIDLGAVCLGFDLDLGRLWSREGEHMDRVTEL